MATLKPARKYNGNIICDLCISEGISRLNGETAELRKDAERINWLEQLTDTDLICDLVVNWKSRDKRWPAGMRGAIDAAMEGGAR